MIDQAQIAETLEDLKPYFCQIADVQLKDFGESANSGPWVSFRLPDPESLEVYRGQDRSGRNARTGKRYKLLVIEVNEDETFINHDARQRMENPEPKPRKLSQIAGGLCQTPKFREWITHNYGVECPDNDAAAQFIREFCGVESRAHLDSVKEAGDVFRTVMAEFEEWRAAQPEQAGGD